MTRIGTGLVGLLLTVPPFAAAGPLHFEGAVGEDMKPAPSFTAETSPDLSGRSGRLHVFSVAGPYGARSIRFRVSADVPAGTSWRLRVTDLAGRREFLRDEIIGPLEPEWLEEVPASRVLLVVESDTQVAGPFVMKVEALSHRAEEVRAEGIVGKKNIRPYFGEPDPVKAWGRPVVRVRNIASGVQKTCSGFLVSASLVITNSHCVSTQQAVEHSSFTFGLDSEKASVTTHRKGTLVLADAAHDISIIRLRKAETGFGRLKVTTEVPAVGRKLRLIHFPNREVKKISDDDDCTVSAVDVPGSTSATTDMKHGCDSVRGSSGAPVLDRDTGQVVALHHLGCEDAACSAVDGWVNQAVPFAKIIPWLRSTQRETLANEILGVAAEASETTQAPAVALADTSADDSGEPVVSPASAVLEEPPPSVVPAAREDPRAVRTGREIVDEYSEPAFLPGSWGRRFQFAEENDVFGLTNPSDNFYSQGLRLGQRWVVPAERRVFRRWDVASAELFGVEVGQNIYTPSDIAISAPARLRSDRPYAGYFYVGAIWDALLQAPWALGNAGFEDAATSALMVEIAFGWTGPTAAGQEIQTQWHALMRSINGTDRPRRPEGWGAYQTANAASIDVSLRYQADLLGARWDLGRVTSFSGSELGVALSPRVRIDAGGLFGFAEPGVEVRAGLMSTPVDPQHRPRLHVQAYLFGRADFRWVLQNRLISGPLRNDVASEARPARTVRDLTAGALVRIGPIELAYAQLWRTNELASPVAGAPDVHNVGEVHFSVLY